MLLDRSLYDRIVEHSLCVIENSPSEESPFPHVLFKSFFPEDVFQALIKYYPAPVNFVSANPKHHTNEYGDSTRRRLTLAEETLKLMPTSQRKVWTTTRAAISCTAVRDAIFAKLAAGLCRRFKIDQSQLKNLPAFPRGQLYSEVDGYKIAPHPDTREKVVTMQFAFPHDDSLRQVGTEFYTRSLNPLHFLREPRGFVVAKTMPFLPNHAYAFSVLNDIGLKSWHGRSTIQQAAGTRNSLLHIWYAEPDDTHAELEKYQQFLRPKMPLRLCA